MTHVADLASRVATVSAQAFAVTTGAAVAQGDLLIVGCQRTVGTSVDTLASVTDSQSNTYHVDVAGLHVFSGNSVGVASAYLATALTSTDTVTCNWTNASAASFFSGILTVARGSATSSWTDQVASANAFRTQAQGITSGATSTLSQADEFVYGLLIVKNSTETITAGSGFTLGVGSGGTYQDTNAGTTTATEWKLVNATTAQTATGTWVTGNQSEGAIAVTYKAAGAAASGCSQRIIGGGLIGCGE